MKLIAHRGWSAGSGENTLAAFARAASHDSLSGVEFDVRRGVDGATLVVSHDPPAPDEPALTLDAAVSLLAGTHLELFVELKEPGIAAAAIEKLHSAGMAKRSVVFAFPGVARSFPWRQPRSVRLGIIILYPWSIRRLVDACAPDVVLLGWDERHWTRIAFRAWWSVLSLTQLARRCSAQVVVGVVGRAPDIRWLSRQSVYAAVIDMDRVGEDVWVPNESL
ncbi:MAG TPA: glycerophosphodiester phosphodiesterase [Xanthobacteraceae bacterium]|nr:glycerophosphodiester phosphodiesterase [Xanthobacteraceae bacterium]